MTYFAALVGLAVLIGLVAAVVRLVVRDGLGCVPVPRSHEAELGTWADRQLRR